MNEPEPTGSELKAGFLVGFEIRHVPLNWHHPVREGWYAPLDPIDSLPATLEIYNEYPNEGGKIYTAEDFSDSLMPDFSCMPEEQMGISAYDIGSGDSFPVSPVFPNTPEGRFQMVSYCAENSSVFAGNKADIETWAALLFGNNSPTVDLMSGRVEIVDESTPPTV